MKKTNIFSLIGIGLVLILIDQVLKLIIVNYLPADGFFVYNILGVAQFQNPGVAFGLAMPKLILYLVVFLVLYFLLQRFKKELEQGNFLILLALTLVIAGAFSNLIDRVFRGFVVDYIHIFTAVFNLADIYIVAGIVVLLFVEFRKAKNQE